MSTQLLILVIAAVAGASAIVGYALGRFYGARRLRDTQAARARLGAALANVPGGFVTWFDGGEAEVSDGLAKMVGGADVGFEAFLGKFGDADRQRVERLVDGLRGRGEAFSLTLLTIDAGYMTLDRGQFDIHTMIAGVFALNRERARGKEQKLVLDCAPDIGSMFADERRLKQVLFNLVSNAIKFTPERGVITLASRVVGDQVEFRVADTGVGIHADERERVLEKFERGNRPRGRQSGVGAGLGLSLVKSFVELHGGDVQIESEPEEGTAIVCRLPRRAQTPAPEGNAA